MQLALVPSIRAIKGMAAPETFQVSSRARELLGDGGTLAEQLTVRGGLFTYYQSRADYRSALEIAQQCLPLTTREDHPEHGRTPTDWSGRY